MPESCTCGAQLAPDSLFCHKCGKPQRDIVAVEEEQPIAAIPIPAVMPPAVRVEPPAVDFHNQMALKIAFLMAVLATPLASLLPFVNFLAGGFFAVLMYRRRTGQLLNLESGVKLGWITGILMFVIMVVIIAVSMAVIAAAGGVAALPAEMRNTLDPRAKEMLKMLQSAPQMAQLLVMLFVFTTLLSMAGGALGAKLSRRAQ
jgi:uncharacterized Tic20 family protein